ncbi:inactive serine protease 54-like isoform X2 [Rhinoderma darwinii]|uniref:inactive serine protease 54-like isoform X2 n=1 Tax=Rhinoderma darwinii TaxID=43563 RepID=UPI003F67CD68
MGRFFYLLLLIWANLGCGVRKITSSHFMEHEASSGEFPWQVFLKPDSGRICSGTIIAEFWILSSAQCFTETTTTILMEAGELNLGFQGKVYPIRKLIRHTDYDGTSSNNTLALLETTNPIMFNDMVLPACYPEDDLLDADLLVNCWVTTMKESTQDGSDNTASVLKKIQFVPIQPCPINNVTDIICATASNVGISDCTVNSGDALMCQYVTNKAWIVVGTAAIEKTDCNTTVIFTRTASYITWLKESTETEGKPIIPETNSEDLTEKTSNEDLADLTEGTLKEEDPVHYTVYSHEEIPSIERTEVRIQEHSTVKQAPNKESKLETEKMLTISLFYTQAFLVFLTT